MVSKAILLAFPECSGVCRGALAGEIQFLFLDKLGSRPKKPNMAPQATNTDEANTGLPSLGLQLPVNATKRLAQAGIDVTAYPTRPEKPEFLDQVYSIRSEFRYNNPTAVVY